MERLLSSKTATWEGRRFVAGVDFGDFLVWRRDGVPSYQLACVADDAAMRITEVVRGADLLKSTARQILLNRALGFADPKWFHCELSVDEQGRRLAKRHDALSIRELRRRGMDAGGNHRSLNCQAALAEIEIIPFEKQRGYDRCTS